MWAMNEWSVSRVEQLAPDAASLGAARGLARPAKWARLGRTEAMAWGECQGSGASPYQVRVDLTDVAYKCSCPSRKLPCKHTLALLLLLAGQSLPEAPPPAFVDEWATARSSRTAAKAARAATPARPPDARAQAQRIEQREARIDSGLSQLETWLCDLIAQGLAAARAQPAAFWEQMAARLVDAQAPGLARRIRALAHVAASRDDWQSRLLSGLARVQMLVEAYRRREQLPTTLAAEVRVQIGWTQDQESVLGGDGLRDTWEVCGIRRSGDEQLMTQFVWLVSQTTGAPALILEFAPGTQPFRTVATLGETFEAEVAYFDAAVPLRALIKTRGPGHLATTLAHATTVNELETRVAGVLALNPFAERWPAVLGPVTAAFDGERCVLKDGRSRLATVRGFHHGWHLVALSRFEPVTLFGEWTPEGFDPVSVASRGRIYGFAVDGAQPVLLGAA